MTDLETVVAIREHLRTITQHWATTSDPMRLGSGGTLPATSRLPGSTVELRADVTLTLAYWIHAMIDEWPSVIQHLAEGDDGKLIVVTGTLDCTNVYAMASLLDREAERLADWDNYGPTIVEDLRPLAMAVRSIAKPPRRESVVIGDCPMCLEPVKVRPATSAPQPTTDPNAYPLWTSIPTSLVGSAIIRHACGYALTFDEWHTKLMGNSRPLTAAETVKEIHSRLGLRYAPITLRVWARRGLITTRGQSRTGQNLYDLREVLEALMGREATRDEMSRTS